MIPNCAATRHAHFTLDGSGIAELSPPSLEDWPKIKWDVGPRARKVNLNELTADDVASWQPGETLLYRVVCLRVEMLRTKNFST